MLFKLLTALPLAQTAPEEGAPALPDPGPSPMAIFSDSSLRRADLLNHPEKLAQALTELNIVWAVIFMVLGARAVISFCIRSEMPGYIVEPPDMTMLPYRSLRISKSHFMIELYVVSCTPAASRPRNEGWNRASGQRKHSLPMVIT